MGAARLVLVVDDDEDIRAALCAVLEEEGYETTAVANGREAFEFLRKGRLPAVVLLDLMMPVMDGWQFRNAQRRDPLFAAVPVVAITASGVDANTAHQLGVRHCLPKPLDIGPLLAAIESSVAPLPPTSAGGSISRGPLVCAPSGR
jgi:CheY-like chemotaxis protein